MNILTKETIMQIVEQNTKEELTPAFRAFIDELSPEDIIAISAYYRWVQRRNVKNEGISELINDKRRTAMQKALGATDWEFSGHIRYVGEGAPCRGGCGKMVQNAYFAYSPTTNTEVAFGEKCLSNFLGIDQAVIRRFDTILAQTNVEVAKALSYGKFNVKLKESQIYGIFKGISLNEKLNHAFVQKAGITAVEVAMNLIACGLVVPTALNNLLIQKYREVLFEELWLPEQITLFDEKYKYISAIDRKGESTVYYKESDKQEFTPEKINTGTDMGFIVQMPFLTVLNSLALNGFAYGHDFFYLVLKEKSAAFLNTLGQLNVILGKLKGKGNNETVALRLKQHLQADSKATPVQILCDALITGNTNLVFAFFDIESNADLLCVLQQYIQPVFDELKVRCK